MVEIIPKPTARIPLWQNFLFYFSIVLVLFICLGLLFLSGLQKKASRALSDLEGAIVGKQILLQDLEKDVLGYQRKISDFSRLAAEHKNSLKPFSLLEDATHPKIQFTSVDFDLEIGKIGLGGVSDSFSVLGQQILILKEADWVRDLRLSKIAIAKQGGAIFSLSLSLGAGVFR